LANQHNITKRFKSHAPTLMCVQLYQQLATSWPSIHYYELTIYYGETWHTHAIYALMNKKQLPEKYTFLRRVHTCPQKQCNQLPLGSQWT